MTTPVPEQDDPARRALAAFGADPQRWPPALRDAEHAAALPATERAAARALDDWLDALQAPAPSAALQQRLLAAMPAVLDEDRSWRRLWRDLGGWRLLGPSLACGLLLGVLLSSIDAMRVPAGEQVDLLSIGMIDSAYEDYP